MKHSLQITLILLGMFLVTQFIGLVVVNDYRPSVEQVNVNGTLTNVTVEKLPEGFQPPQDIEPMSFIIMILISFSLALGIMFVMMKFGLNRFLRFWFFAVVVIALGLTMNALFNKFPALNSYLVKDTLTYSFLISILIAIPLAIYKTYKRNFFIHNLTELLIYPGIAAVLVPMFIDDKGWLVGKLALLGLNIPWNIGAWPVILILVGISIYDMWAVWHSKIMIKMAKYQMNKLKFFAGFFVPYLGKKEREEIQIIKDRYKEKKIPESVKKKKFQVSLAILGGGDVVFPIITSGVFMRLYGVVPALFVIFGSFFALLYLFFIAEKKKFYPAMPFISGGIFIGLILWKLIYLLL
jgi:presenilin-like A22 family membrane protease